MRYAKFIVAVLWAIAQFALLAFGVDISALVTDIVSLLVALGVFAVPNTYTTRNLP
jgi:uncharacterized membrane protein